MTRREDENLREVLEALTRLRLSHDRRVARECAARAEVAAVDGVGRPCAREEASSAVTERYPRVNTATRRASAEASGVLTERYPQGNSPSDSAACVASEFPRVNSHVGLAPVPDINASVFASPGAVAAPWPDAPWIDEVGAEPELAAMVGARAVSGPNAHGSMGAYLRREVAVETRLPHLRGLTRVLCEALPEMASLAGVTRDVDLLAAARPEDLLFLDLETTGLHRGIIVLLGFMRAGPGERPLTVTQLFPRDYGEEAHLLGEFIEHLRGQPLLVTFNGRSFDAPYLESRLRFHGWFEPLRFAHVDLLHLARRLWKGRLPNFKLQTLERGLFGRKRLADLPGSEVPRVWEDYVNYRELRHLPGIWEHNLRDLATLAEIIVRAAQDARLSEISDEN